MFCNHGDKLYLKDGLPIEVSELLKEDSWIMLDINYHIIPKDKIKDIDFKLISKIVCGKKFFEQLKKESMK
jgi:hypothetical protein